MTTLKEPTAARATVTIRGDATAGEIRAALADLPARAVFESYAAMWDRTLDAEHPAALVLGFEVPPPAPRRRAAARKVTPA